MRGKLHPLTPGLDPGGEEPLRSNLLRSILGFCHARAVTPDDAGGPHHTVLRIDERYAEALTIGQGILQALPELCF